MSADRVPVSAIVIGERVRKDMGDLASLAESIKSHGLLHPIVVMADGTLVAGHRRLEAVKLLGWSEVPVTFIDIEADLLGCERDENEERKGFTPTEAVAIGRLIEERHRKKIAETRHALAVQAGKIARGTFDPNGLEGPLPPNGSANDVAARAVGMGRGTYWRARDVVKAAEANPEKFGDLPQQMDETGNVSAAHEEMKRRTRLRDER